MEIASALFDLAVSLIMLPFQIMNQAVLGVSFLSLFLSFIAVSILVGFLLRGGDGN